MSDKVVIAHLDPGGRTSCVAGDNPDRQFPLICLVVAGADGQMRPRHVDLGRPARRPRGVGDVAVETAAADPAALDERGLGDREPTTVSGARRSR